MFNNKNVLGLLFFVLILSSCSTDRSSLATTQTSPLDETSSTVLTAEDGVSIYYTYYPGSSSQGIILLHMLNADRSSWDNIPSLLQQEGYHVIAIDFRGHGESIEKGRWQSFDDSDFNDMIFDVEAATTFLETKSVSSVAIIGASIGANIALQYAAANPVAGIVLLSPGLDYRGITTEDAIIPYGNNPLFIAVSEDDVYSFESSQVLDEKALGEHKVIIYSGSAHGTRMFSHNDLLPEISLFLNNIFK